MLTKVIINAHAIILTQFKLNVKLDFHFIFSFSYFRLHFRFYSQGQPACKLYVNQWVWMTVCISGNAHINVICVFMDEQIKFMDSVKILTVTL